MFGIGQINKMVFLAGDIAMIGTGNFMINAVGDHSEKVDAGFYSIYGK